MHALIMVLSLVILGGGAAPVSSTPPSPPSDSLGRLPEWHEPAEGQVHMRIVHEGDTLGITKYLSKGRSRTDMVAQGMAMSMIDLGDADQTTISLMPAQKMAMKQSRAKAMKMGGETASEIAEPPADIAGHVKLVGSEMLGGRAANKYRVDVNGETAYAWNNPVTGAPRRMESSTGTIDWSDPIVGPQKDELFTIPKGYQIMDMDEMMSKMGAAGPLGAMGGMGGMGGIGGMAKGMGVQAASNFGGSLGSAAGASLGGPLGAMAGQYIGSKVAGWIAGKAANAIAPSSPAGLQAPRTK